MDYQDRDPSYFSLLVFAMNITKEFFLHYNIHSKMNSKSKKVNYFSSQF